MVHSLYARLMAFQCLLVVIGGLFFWLVAVKMSVPEPMSLILSGFGCMVIAAIVLGVVLQPLDQIHLALKHLAYGEDVILAPVRGADHQRLLAALTLIQQRLASCGPKQAGNTELLEVINSLGEGVMILDRTLKCVHLNTALRLMATAESSTPGKSLDGDDRYRLVFHERTFVPDQLALVEEQMCKAPDRPRTDIIQLERPQQFLKRYSAPLYNDKQEQTGYLVSYQDITHEVIQDRLRQEFIANASHELRTPVTSVKVLLENLVDGAKDDPAVADEFIADAAREIDRMHDLVNDLLDLAALESGRNTLAITSFEVQKVIWDAVSSVAPQAKQRDVRVESDVPPDAISVEADQSRVRQILVNLVANAVKFTPSGGQVKVRLWKENGSVRMCVSDTGIGIPAQDLPHIFDRFFRVTRGRSRLQGGSGLGLTIVKQAIDAHRGEINVESTEGQGTSFIISLPAVQAEL